MDKRLISCHFLRVHKYSQSGSLSLGEVPHFLLSFTAWTISELSDWKLGPLNVYYRKMMAVQWLHLETGFEQDRTNYICFLQLLTRRLLFLSRIQLMA